MAVSVTTLGYFEDELGNEVTPSWPEQDGFWEFDDADFALYALLCDNVYCSELLCEDPSNREYGGMYTVRDYQYVLNRKVGSNYVGYTCARSVGKTESIKNRAMSHGFRRLRENLLISTPELIHLLPLTDAIEDRIYACRLTRDFLDTDAGRTGFTHRPFGVDYADGTKIIGRIPRMSGIGVKGQHQPDLIIDEAQDYPESGWKEVHECQPLDAHINTPAGLREMGDLKVGDHVIGVDGRPTEVVGIYPQGEREVLRMWMSDGTFVECDADHLWTVRPRVGRSWRVMRAHEIAAGAREWFVPELGGPVEMHGPVPDIDPYLLGLLIGDGGFTAGIRFATEDRELIDAIAAALPEGDEIVHTDRCNYRIRKSGPRNNHVQTATQQYLEGCWPPLMGCRSEQKGVPDEFLSAPAATRLALLQGLIDSDGNVHRSGSVRFGSTSARLADDVLYLVRSLGGRVTSAPRPDARGHLTMYTLHFRLPEGMCAARLRRKADKIHGFNPNGMTRRIVRVERTGHTKPMQCIEVAADNGLYATGLFSITHNTVMKDTDDFSYIFYGVHSGARDTGFYRRATTGGFKIVQITAIQRPGWNAAEKEAAKAAYGGTSSPDYRRNILGEAGAAASPLFVTARLIACMDPDRDSAYNLNGYKYQEIHVEQFDELMLPIADVLDLPMGIKRAWAGGDLGLTNSPTVFMIFSEEKVDGIPRMRLVRRIHLNRMRVKQIRFAIYAIFSHFGDALQGFGLDETGLGFPICQEIEDDENKPIHMDDRFRGYFFNSKVPVGIERGMVTQDSAGNWRDQYGASVTVRQNPLTLDDEYIVWMPMIEASTRYLREMVDTTFFEFPFDPEVIGDMQGDTAQRIKRIAGLKQKPNAFHILDAERAFSMVYKGLGDDGVEAQINTPPQRPVLDMAM